MPATLSTQRVRTGRPRRFGVSTAVRLGVCLAGGTWALTLVCAGWWLCLTAPRRWPMIAVEAAFAGGALIGAGVLVFGVLVGDRLFPSAERRWAWGVELLAGLVALGGLVALAVRAVV